MLFTFLANPEAHLYISPCLSLSICVSPSVRVCARALMGGACGLLSEEAEGESEGDRGREGQVSKTKTAAVREREKEADKEKGEKLFFFNVEDGKGRINCIIWNTHISQTRKTTPPGPPFGSPHEQEQQLQLERRQNQKHKRKEREDGERERNCATDGATDTQTDGQTDGGLQTFRSSTVERVMADHMVLMPRPN